MSNENYNLLSFANRSTVHFSSRLKIPRVINLVIIIFISDMNGTYSNGHEGKENGVDEGWVVVQRGRKKR